MAWVNGKTGTTAERPTVGLFDGRRYYDTDLATTIMWNGTAWVIPMDADVIGNRHAGSTAGELFTATDEQLVYVFV